MTSASGVWDTSPGRPPGGVSVSARYDANLSSRTSEQLLSLDARVAWQGRGTILHPARPAA